MENKMQEEFLMPDIGDDQVEITEISIKINELVKLDQAILTVEGSKASMEIPATKDFIVKEIMVNIGDMVTTNTPLALVEPVVEKKEAIKIEKNIENNIKDKKSQINQQEINPQTIDQNKNASPIVRRLARIHNINLNDINGTGRKNRITKEDILNYLDQSSLNGLNNEIEYLNLTKIQTISAQNLTNSWQNIPMVTQFDEVNISNLDEFRQNLQAKISPLIFIIKALAKTLEQYPKLNSSINDNLTKLTLHKHINIGVAVDTSQGLLVPVIKNANQKSIQAINNELQTLSKQAKNNQLKINDMQDATFTISSLGKVGGIQFTPIINPPEVGILGVSKSSIKPVWNGEKFEPKTILPLALTYDHRAIDGVYGASFMNRLNEYLTDIRKLIL